MDPQSESLALERLKLQADYLQRHYGYYTTHMNQVFSFYLVTVGLIAGAFVESLATDSGVSAEGSRAIAVTGALLSLCFSMLHARSNVIAGIIDDQLGALEPQIGVTFQKARKKSTGVKNKHLFPLLYGGFCLGFFLAAVVLVSPPLETRVQIVWWGGFAVLVVLAWLTGPRPPKS